jgi:hypothetical protein
MTSHVKFDCLNDSIIHVDNEDDQKSDEESSLGVNEANIFSGGNENGANVLPSLGRRLSWTSVSTCNLSEPLYYIAKEDKSKAEKFRALLRSPRFDRDDMLCSVHNFIGALADYVPSIKNGDTFTIFKSIKIFLSCSESTRLYGLLIHFAYWNVIHPTARQTMRTLQELRGINLFATLDLVHNDTAKRLRIPAALLDIAAAERVRDPKSFAQIDAMFQQHCEGVSTEGNDLNSRQTCNLHPPMDRTDNASYTGTGSLDSDTSLTTLEKEQLFIQLESCIIALFKTVTLRLINCIDW